MNAWVWTAVVALVTLGAQLAVFLRWMHRRIRDDEVTRIFVRDLALRHLPHMYGELAQIRARLGMDPVETPLVNFTDFEGRGKRRSA